MSKLKNRYSFILIYSFQLTISCKIILFMEAAKVGNGFLKCTGVFPTSVPSKRRRIIHGIILTSSNIHAIRFS